MAKRTEDRFFSLLNIYFLKAQRTVKKKAQSRLWMVISLPQGSRFCSDAAFGPEALLVKVAESVRHMMSRERESRGVLAESACPCFELQPPPSSHLLFFWFQIDSLSSLLIPVH